MGEQPTTPGDGKKKPALDPFWQEFEAAEIEKQDKLEKQYREIEHYNAKLLNMVAGLEASGLQYVEPISEEPTGPAPDLSDMRNTLLYLQPDRREELYEVEGGELAERAGNPHVITGDIPPRTQQLIENLLASIDAKKDEAQSNDTQEIWHGVVGTQPVKIIISHSPYRSEGLRPDGTRYEKRYRLHSMRAYREPAPSIDL